MRLRAVRFIDREGLRAASGVQYLGLVGMAAVLLGQSDRHRAVPASRFLTYLQAAAEFGFLAIGAGGDGQSCAVSIWAWVDLPTAKRLAAESHPADLHPSEWREGRILMFLDVQGPPGMLARSIDHAVREHPDRECIVAWVSRRTPARLLTRIYRKVPA